MLTTVAQAWQNWAGNQRADSVEVVTPSGVEGIAAAITAAREAGQRIRPIGSGHSFTAVGTPTDVQLRLDRHDVLIDVDEQRQWVTVQAGMPLHVLNRLLEQRGLAMSNLGDIERQTISGALATGTHGTGRAHGGLATQLRGLELVLADGSVLTCSIDEHPDVFDLARVHLGALGVVSALTLQVEPLYAVHAREGSAGLDETLQRFDEWADDTDHFEFYWFPHTRRCLTKHNTRTRVEDGLDPIPTRSAWWEDEFMSNTVFGAMVGLGRRVPAVVRPLAHVAAHALSPREFTDLSYKVFTSERRVRFEEMEYAVPREHLVPLLTELVRTVERSDWRIAFPVEVRVAPADDVPLSTAYGRDSAYVAVHVPAGDPVREQYFGVWESIVREVGGRPHWGKLHSLRAAELAERYPRFGDFVALRDRLDPDRIFSNPYLDRVLGR